MRPCILTTTVTATLCTLASTTMATPPSEPTASVAAPDRERPIIASPSTPVRDLHISFSGGGFFSHTVLSGVVSGIIDHQMDGLNNPDYETQLDHLFGRTKHITSNSGGSWFMSQLAFSPTFQTGLENTRLAWDSGAGYLGQAELFTNIAPCPFDSVLPSICNSFGNSVLMLEYFQMNWERLVTEGVHMPWGMWAELTTKSLKSDPAYQASIRNRWARDINLSYGATIAVTNSFFNCNGDDGAATYISNTYDALHSKAYVTNAYAIGAGDFANEPAHISSWVSPGTQPRFTKKDLQFTYRYGHGPFGGNYFTSAPANRFLEIDVSPLIASTASSAAMGFMPSINNFRTMTGCDINTFSVEQAVGDIMRRSDVDFYIDESTGTPTVMAYPSALHDIPLTVDTLVSQRRFSLFDGSFSDDLGVVQMLQGLEDRGELAASVEPLKILIIESHTGGGGPFLYDGEETGLLMAPNTQKLFKHGTNFDYFPQENSGVEHLPATVFEKPELGSYAIDSSGLVAGYTRLGDPDHDPNEDSACFILLRSYKSRTPNFNPFHPIITSREVEVMVLEVVGAEYLAAPPLQGIEAVLLPSNPAAWDYLHFCYEEVRTAMSLPEFAPLMEFLGDECPNDPNKWLPGDCGCGNPETDTDGDGTPDCVDGCPLDVAKTEPGDCGCGVAETGDFDGDGTPDCNDDCPTWPYDCSDDGATITVAVGEPIQQAIEAVPDGGTVILASGTHTVGQTLRTDGRGVSIIGASAVDPDLPPTIIEGAVGGPVGGGFLFHFENHFEVENTVLLEGLEIRNAAFGAVLVKAALVNFKNVRFINNTGSTGGALYLDNLGTDTLVIIIGCEFSGNRALSNGGAIYAAAPSDHPISVMIIDTSVIQDNRAELTGGGLYLTSGTEIVMGDSIVCGNLAGTGAMQVNLPDQILSPAGPNCIGEYCVDVDDDGVIDGCSDTHCPGDINGDGQVDAADLGLLIGAWDTNDADADINDDGNVDAADLGLVIGAWGLCA